MNRSRGEALDEFLLYVGEEGDEAARNVAERVLDTAIETIWLAHPWLDYQSPVPLELTLTIGQRSYALPPYVGRLLPLGRCRNQTQDVLLTQISLEQYQTLDTADTGAPEVFTLGGVSGVFSQPVAAGEAVEWLSTSSEDTDVSVTIEGDDGAGQWMRYVAPLNGTAPVAAGVWTYVDGASKGMDTPAQERTSSRGTVTLRTVTGGRVLVSLAADESSREHLLLSVYPTPTAADTLAIPIVRRPKRLRSVSDPLPTDWWPAILEEMLALWRVNTGEVSDAAMLARPKLRALIEHDNALRARARVRPYGTS
jgi:hypothetical protein